MQARPLAQRRGTDLQGSKPAAHMQAGASRRRPPAHAVMARAAGARGARARAWKSACSPAISSGDMPAAMTLSASFFSLFMPAKPRMRVRITLSSGRSLAVPFSRIQLCARIASAVARRFGSCAAHARATVSAASPEASGAARACMSGRAGSSSRLNAVRSAQRACAGTLVTVHRILCMPSVPRRRARARAAGGAGAAQRAHRLQHRAHALLGLRADGRPGVRLEVEAALQDGVEDLLLRLAPERRHAAQQDVQDHAARPDVGLLAVVPPQHLREAQARIGPSPLACTAARRAAARGRGGGPADRRRRPCGGPAGTYPTPPYPNLPEPRISDRGAAHLGRDVVRAAQDLGEHLARAEEGGEPKVGRLELRAVALVGQQEVLGLQVAGARQGRVGFACAPPRSCALQAGLPRGGRESTPCRAAQSCDPANTGAAGRARRCAGARARACAAGASGRRQGTGGHGGGGAPVDDAQVVAVRDHAYDRANELRGVLLAAARAGAARISQPCSRT